MTGLKNRIYIQNGIIIIVIVFFLESIFLFGVRNYYMESVERELLNKAKISGSFYNKYLVHDSIEDKARYILENDSKDRNFYMQVFNVKKIMLTDSNGFHSTKPYESKDINMALKGKTEGIGIEENEESIMAIAVPLYDNRGRILGALRYVTSIEAVQKEVSRISRTAVFVGISVVIITFLFSSFLAKRIVNPIKELTHSAQKMAKGDFSQRVPKRYDDEVGKLSDTLNFMLDEIIKSNAIKNEFISSVSHELRTPLTAIKGWSEIMLTGEINNFEEAKEGMKIIYDETERLNGLVEELLDFSKLESGRITLTLEKINMNDLVLEVGNYFKRRIKQEGLQLYLNMSKNSCFIMGDRNRLKQVLINIIDNAVKFSKKDGFIKLYTYRNKNKVFIEIEDNGVGIGREEIEKVTEKFYKGKSKRSGSGIGLAICKEIISLHGGKLNIESEEKKGTRVIIEILTDS